MQTQRQVVAIVQTKLIDLRCEAATVHIHRPYLLLLLSLKADTHFTVPYARVEGWVDYSVIQPQAHGRFRACVWQAFVCYLASF